MTVSMNMESMKKKSALALNTCNIHVRWETPRGRYDECSSKFSLSYEIKVIESVGLESIEVVEDEA